MPILMFGLSWSIPRGLLCLSLFVMRVACVDVSHIDVMCRRAICDVSTSISLSTSVSLAGYPRFWCVLRVSMCISVSISVFWSVCPYLHVSMCVSVCMPVSISGCPCRVPCIVCACRCFWCVLHVHICICV